MLCVSKKELKGEETVASCLAKGERFAIIDPYGMVRILTPEEVELTKAFNPKAFETRAFGMKYQQDGSAAAAHAVPDQRSSVSLSVNLAQSADGPQSPLWGLSRYIRGSYA